MRLFRWYYTKDNLEIYATLANTALYTPDNPLNNFSTNHTRQIRFNASFRTTTNAQTYQLFQFIRNACAQV